MDFVVQIKHYQPVCINGYLEDELIIEHTRVYKTRREAKQYIENMLFNKNVAYRDYHKGDMPSTCLYFTDKTWINEKTGIECHEYYQFVLTKV